MQLIRKYARQALTLFAVTLVFSACDKNDDDMPDPIATGPDLVFYGLTADNQLVQLNANKPGMAMATVAISGVQTGEKIIGIDYRPATGQLIGLGNTSRLYTINASTGAVTAIGMAPFTPAINGTIAGFDFNPTVDRIRLVTNTGQNLRLNPETGGVAATDGALNPGTPSIAGSAYTNSMAGATTTTLFGIDVSSQKLMKQDPPNVGTLAEVGALGVTATGDVGFDIAPDNSAALATMTVNNVNGLYGIDIATGKATFYGQTSTPLIGIAIPAPPVAYAVDDMNNLLIFNFNAPGTPLSKPVTGLQAGESIVGIDMRPATGQLFALGSTSRIYTIHTSTAVATAVGMQLSTPLNGTSFGFDFNPTVDRIRVISNTGQNLRLNPIDGTIAATDMLLNPGTPAVSAAAYTNNFAGSTATVLFDIDPSTDKLYSQIPPNNGVLVEIGNLGINVEASNGFDIGGTSNLAYAVLTVGSAAKIYSINLTTGAATAVADFPVNVRGFALGLGF